MSLAPSRTASSMMKLASFTIGVEYSSIVSGSGPLLRASLSTNCSMTLLRSTSARLRFKVDASMADSARSISDGVVT